MTNSYRRHDISDKDWALLEPHLPGRAGQWGGMAKDNRNFINAGRMQALSATPLMRR